MMVDTFIGTTWAGYRQFRFSFFGAFEEIFERLAGAFEELLCQDLKQQQEQQQEKCEAHLTVLRTCSIV